MQNLSSIASHAAGSTMSAAGKLLALAPVVGAVLFALAKLEALRASLGLG